METSRSIPGLLPAEARPLLYLPLPTAPSPVQQRRLRIGVDSAAQNRQKSGIALVSSQAADSSVHADLKAQSSSILQSFAAGSLIIPMDTDTSSNHSSFNQNLGMWKAYGLLYKLLNSGIPVYWSITPAKSFNATDFTVTSVKDQRTSTSLGSYSYSGGPFIIDSTNVAAALPLIQAWWSSNGTVPNVHQALATFSANVNITLRSAPRIADEATNASIAIGYYNAAGIPDLNGNSHGVQLPPIF